METITNYETLKKIIQNDFVIIVAKTHTCSTCKMIVDHLKQTITNLNTIESYQVYVDDCDAFRGEHIIFSVPTVLIFSNGKELLRESRFINTNKINRLINNYLS